MINNPNIPNTVGAESSTADRLFQRIEAESITPVSKMVFRVTQWGIWLVWGLTVICGAVALAISGYVTLSAQYALYEATHENFFTFFVSIVPFIWIGLLALMTYLSVCEIKNTKRGYRYSTFIILGSNMICTVLGAVLLHCLGMGYALDQKFGNQIGMYMSLEKKEQMMWQMPKEGRLVGSLESRLLDGGLESDSLHFKDIRGSLWRLSVVDLSERELALLNQPGPVRLLGTTTSDFSFHVCSVFSWQQGRAMQRKEMREHRAEFDASMLDKIKKIEGWGGELSSRESQDSSNGSLCANLPFMKRMQ